MTTLSITLEREIFKTVASAIRHKLKRREADARRKPWHPSYGPRDLTAEEIDRLQRALNAFEATLILEAFGPVYPEDEDGLQYR